MSDLTRLIRAVRTLDKLAGEYSAEEIAAALVKHCSRKDRDEVAFAGHALLDVWHVYREADDASWPRCSECGNNIERGTTTPSLAPTPATAHQLVGSAPIASAVTAHPQALPKKRHVARVL